MDPFNLELIDEYSNYFLISVITVLNRLINGNSFNEVSFKEAVKTEADDKIYYFTNNFIDDFYSYAGLSMQYDKEGILKPNIENITIPYCMTDPERIYLKSILNSRYARIILDAPTIEETLKHLDGICTIKFDNVFHFTGTRRHNHISEKEISNIRIVLHAIRGNKALKYSNREKDGNIYKDVLCFPIRIEYSVMKDEFSALVWTSEENRPDKLLLSTLEEVNIDDTVWDQKISPQEMMKKYLQKEPLIVEVNKFRDAIERFQFTFSMYEKRTEMLDENKARVEIYYYDFDKDEIIDNIMSFGTMVKIISPTDMITELRKKLYQDLK